MKIDITQLEYSYILPIRVNQTNFHKKNLLNVFLQDEYFLKKEKVIPYQ
jgi:hypothetical protein